VQGELAVQYQVKEETIGTGLSQVQKMLKKFPHFFYVQTL
jgi:hypothetical protein